jgi:tetratricopeptide (TPR) repeat protein
VTPLVIAAVSLVFTAELYAINAELAGANKAIEEQNDELETKNAELEKTRGKLQDSVNQLSQRQTDLLQARARLQRSNKQLTKALDDTTQAERDAQQSFLGALDASDELLQIARRELRRPGLEAVRQKLLVRAVAMCQRFTARPGEHPMALLRAARAYRLTGDLESSLGNTERAIASLDEAVRLYQQLIDKGTAGRIAGIDYESELLEVNLQLWGLLESSGVDRADQVLFSIQRRLERLPEKRRGEPVYRRLAGLWRLDRGVQQQLRGRPERAREEYTQAIAELQTVSSRPDVLIELARAHVNRAALLTAGRERLTDKAGLYVPPATNLALARKDCDIAARLLEKHLANREDVAAASVLGQVYTNLGLVLALLKESEEARQTYQHAIDLFEDLVNRSPLNTEYRQLLAVAQGNLGTHLLRMGRREAGRKHLAIARGGLEKLAQGSRDNPVYRLDLARLATSEGLALIGAGEVIPAEVPLTEAVRWLEDLVRELPQRLDVRDYLLIAIRNLIFIQDRLARLADLRRDRRAVRLHVAQLVLLRQKYEKSLPPLPVHPSWWQRLVRFGERTLIRDDLAGTLRAQASALETNRDHEGAARCLAELRSLLAPDWPGWIECAALLSRCIRLAREDRDVSAAERQRLARRYGRQALDILEELARRRVAGLAGPLGSVDFDPLAGQFRDEFRALKKRVQEGS